MLGVIALAMVFWPAIWEYKRPWHFVVKTFFCHTLAGFCFYFYVWAIMNIRI
jgi:hypothetical protein